TQQYHMEDVHRAGGIMGILGELKRAGLLNTQTYAVLGVTLDEVLTRYDIMSTQDEAVKKFYRSGPAGVRSTTAFSQQCYWPSLDDDRQQGCIRDKANAYSQDGGLATLYGNI